MLGAARTAAKAEEEVSEEIEEIGMQGLAGWTTNSRPRRTRVSSSKRRVAIVSEVKPGVEDIVFLRFELTPSRWCGTGGRWLHISAMESRVGFSVRQFHLEGFEKQVDVVHRQAPLAVRVGCVMSRTLIRTLMRYMYCSWDSWDSWLPERRRRRGRGRGPLVKP